MFLQSLSIPGLSSPAKYLFLKRSRAVEKVQETAPFLKDGSLIFLLCQLVVDILKLYCLGVIVIPDSTDAILEHSVKGNALLSSSWSAIKFLSLFYDCSYFLLFCSCQSLGHYDVPFFRFPEQFSLPPFLLPSAS